jgi:hypothetical protein
MAEKGIVIRLSVADGEKVKKALEGIGKEGEAALRKITAAGKEPSAGLKALGAASDELHGKMGQLAGQSGALGNVLSAFGPVGVTVAAGFAIITGAATKALTAFAEAEKSQLRLAGVLKATGGAAGLTAQQITAFNDALERQTFFTKENLNQASAALATFKSVSGDTFTTAISLAADLAEVFGGDVSSSATQLGKALEDPIKGITALTRVGVTFTVAQKDQIEALVESGELLKAQGIILDTLKGQVGGAAQAVAGGLAGAWDNLGDSVGDAFEAFGEWLNSEGAFTNFINNIAGGIDSLSDKLLELAGNLQALKDADLISQIADKTGQIRERENQNKGFTNPNGFGIRANNDQIAQIRKEQAVLQAELDRRVADFKSVQDKRKAAVSSATNDNDPETPSGRTKLAAARKQDNDELGEYISSLEKQNQLLQVDSLTRKEIEAVSKAQNIAQREGIKLTGEQEARIKAAVAAQEKWNTEQENAKQRAKEMEEANKLAMAPLVRGIENVQDALADMLVEGKFSFESLGSIAKRVAAEAAAAWIIRPLISPIFAGIGGGGGSAGGVAGAGGGSFLGSISPSQIFSAAGALGGGGSNLGMLANNAVFGLTGNYQAASTAFNLGSKFTPGAGLAGLGGGLLGGAVFGNSIGSSIGSTAGGIIGTAIAGPLGSFVGSFLGSGVGSLFGGGKPSSKLQTGLVDLSTGEVVGRTGLTGKKFSQENYDAVTSLAGISAQVAKILGADNAGKLNLQVGNRDGLSYNFEGGAQKSFKDAGELLKSLTTELSALGNASATVKTAIEKIDFSKTEQAISDLNFAAGFDKLGQAPAKISQLEAALKQTADTAGRLGLSVEKVNAAFAAQFNQAVGGSILSITNPRAAAIAAEVDRYQQDRVDALAVQGDLAQVELLHKLKLLQIEQQTAPVASENLTRLQSQREEMAKLVDNWAGLSKQLEQTYNGLRFGELSPLSPELQYREAQAKVRDLIGRGQLGDIGAATELNSFGSQFLSLSKAFNATGNNQAYAQDFDLLDSGLKAVKGTADRQLSLQQQLLTAADREIAVLQGGFSGLSDQIGKLINVKPSASTAGIPEQYAGGAFSANNPNEIVIRNLDKIRAAGLYDSTEALLASLTPGVVPGGGRRSAFFETNTFASLQASMLLKNAGIPGFANGGITPVNSPFLVGERGPEIMQLGQPSTVTPLAVNDNRSLEREVRGLRSDIQELIRVQIASGDQQISLQRNLAGSFASIAQRSQVLAARA